MVSSTEHSKTDENDDRVDENPPEAVASQTDSDTELAKLRDQLVGQLLDGMTGPPERTD